MRWLTLVLAALLTGSPVALAQEASSVEIGIEARFMPTGSFHWSGRPGATESCLGAYPALGAAPFVDYRLNRFVAVGFSPEVTLNVIPRTNYYPISAMVAASLRLKLQYPGLRWLVPYVVLAPGYSLLFTYDNAGGDSGDAHGFVVSGHVGVGGPIGVRHSVFAHVGYMRGFQSRSGGDYAPSYLVLAAGWQVSL
jgi:hypothetical protein